MHTSSAEGLEALSSLSADQKEKLNHILDLIHTGDENDKEKAIADLTSYHLSFLYALSERSPEINDLLESDDSLNKHWSSLLQSLEYPSIPIVSFDGTKTISVFSQLKGAFLLSELGDNPDLNHPNSFVILHKACEIGMFQALVMRMNYFSDLIDQKNGLKNERENIDTYVQYILKDAQKLSNLYWAIGCIDTALILFNIAENYFKASDWKSPLDGFRTLAKTINFSWMKKYDDNTIPFPLKILEAAVENLYIARLLAEFPQSKEISDQISHGEGLMAAHEESFKTLDDLQALVRKKLDGLRVPLIESFCSNAYKHSTKKINEYHPDFELPEDPPEMKMKG